MSVTDWIFLGTIVASMLFGAWRGMVYEVFSLIAWGAAFVLAQWFAPDMAHRLPMAGASESMRYALGFVVVFVVTVFVGGIVAMLLSKVISAVGLGPVDRLLGALFGLLRGALILLSVTIVVSMTPLKTAPSWRQAQGPYLSEVALKALRPVLPANFGKYLP